jgi:hypothetical protein
MSMVFENEINKYSSIILEPSVMASNNRPFDPKEKSPKEQLRLRKLNQNRDKIQELVEEAKNIILPSKRQKMGASSLVFHKDQLKNVRLPKLQRFNKDISRTPKNEELALMVPQLDLNLSEI